MLPQNTCQMFTHTHTQSRFFNVLKTTDFKVIFQSWLQAGSWSEHFLPNLLQLLLTLFVSATE